MASPLSCRACAGPYSLLPALVLLVTYSFASPHQPRATAFSLRVVSPFRSRTHEEDERSAPPAIARRKLASSLPCTNSSLFGYAYAVQLGDGLILHWKPQVGRVTDMALQAVALSGAQKGWISVGWSGDGRMSRSDAVVGNVDNYPSRVVALYLAGRNFADVKPAGYDLGRTVLEQGTTGSFVIKFSRRVDDGTVRFDPTGANTLIWAYSADPGSSELGFHGGNKGSALVDFSCTGKAASPLIQTGSRLAAVLAVVLAVLCLAL
ncbi:unnamed protein product [Closterium sp. Naga37s-1]|nr:unnamed protein product [Closterium sp. Naga37s-1]